MKGLAMKRRRKTKTNFSLRSAGPIPERTVKTITVPVYLPLPVARVARREIYPYPPIQPRTRSRRHVRVRLRRSRAPLVKTSVTIAVPRRAQLNPGSKVSVGRRGSLTIHSARSLRRTLEHERNRRRYSEHKSNRRRYRDGQLASLRSDPLAIVGSTAARSPSVRRLADAALVSRAITGG